MPITIGYDDIHDMNWRIAFVSANDPFM